MRPASPSPPSVAPKGSKDPEFTPTLRKVIQEEQQAIAVRRKTHDSKQNHGKVDCIVGLAFSGGGIRSASFNLGLLQAFFRHGLLKHIDYLSTVSGGGYIGSYLLSLLQQPDVQLQKDNVTLRKQLCANPAQPPRIVHFVRNGKYLSRPNAFSNQYLIGLFFNNLAIISGLALASLALATLWRLLDTNPVAGFIYLKGWPKYFWTELYRPFLPAIVLFSAWLLVWAYGYVKSTWTGSRPQTRLTRRLLLAAGACLLIGIAVVLATPVISIPQVGTDDHENEGVLEVSGQQRLLSSSIIAFIVTALSPFLRPQLLLRSGIHPKSIWERRIFVVASSALIAGVPFILIWWFAHHDFAGKDLENRDRALWMGDINFRTWSSFWTRMGREEKEADTPGHFIMKALKSDKDVEEIVNDIMKSVKKGEAVGEIVNDTAVEEIANDPTLPQRMKELPVPLDHKAYETKDKLIKAINEYVIFKEGFGEHVVHKCMKLTPDGNHDLSRDSDLDHRIRHHSESPRIHTLIGRLLGKQLIPEESKELNRLLLEVFYPEEILPRSKIYRQNVIEEDQKARLQWLLALLGVFLVASLINLNATSLHSFYRDRLAMAFLEPMENKSRTIQLSDLRTTESGGPYPLLSATLNRMPLDREPPMLTRNVSALQHGTETSTRSGPPNSAELAAEHPGETATQTFLLSRLYCGADSLGYRRTNHFMQGRLELDDAMAISGAAFSPIQTGNPFIGFLMTLFNMRLGQWVHDPHRGPGAPWNRLHWVPTVYSVIRDHLRRGSRPAWYFLTDGGHHENLGIWPLLERRCKLIIVSDASQDEVSGFADLLRVIRRARFEKGIELEAVACPGPLGDEHEDELVRLLKLLHSDSEPGSATKAGASGKDPGAQPSQAQVVRKSQRHFLVAQIKYPDREDTGLLIYIKPTLTGDESAELYGYAVHNPDFPHSPTLDQLYDEDRFESYRQLGDHIGSQLCLELIDVRQNAGETMWDWPISANEILECTGVLAAQEKSISTVAKNGDNEKDKQIHMAGTWERPRKG